MPQFRVRYKHKSPTAEHPHALTVGVKTITAPDSTEATNSILMTLPVDTTITSIEEVT